MKTPRLIPLFIISIILVVTTGMRPLAATATITVNTFSDEFGTGAACSLREAIESANNDTDFGGCTASGEYGDDTIVLPAGTYTLTRPPTGGNNNTDGDLFLLTSIELIGQGLVIIDAGGDEGIHDRVMTMHFMVPSVVSLTNLTITGGRIPAAESGFPGLVGGGIQNYTNLTLNHVTVTDNKSGDGNTGGQGGGIFASGPTYIVDSIISNNRAGNGAGGGTAGSAGGLGGGIFIVSSEVTIIDSSIIGNTAGSGEAGDPGGMGGSGGGIYVNSSGITISGSTISGNSAGSSSGYDGGNGGGIYANGQFTMVNCTVSGNTSGSSTHEFGAPGDGGGIQISSLGTTIRYATITNNHIGSGTYSGYGGGIYSEGENYLTLGATLLAGNMDNNGYYPDCFTPGYIISEDYNLIGNTAGCNLNIIPGHNILDPVGFSLPPLGNFGGLTQTHPLPIGNPAIDQIPYGTNGCGTTYTLDQRAMWRFVDGDQNGTSLCDIGAYEFQLSSFLPILKR